MHLDYFNATSECNTVIIFIPTILWILNHVSVGQTEGCHLMNNYTTHSSEMKQLNGICYRNSWSPCRIWRFGHMCSHVTVHAVHVY